MLSRLTIRLSPTWHKEASQQRWNALHMGVWSAEPPWPHGPQGPQRSSSEACIFRNSAVPSRHLRMSPRADSLRVRACRSCFMLHAPSPRCSWLKFCDRSRLQRRRQYANLEPSWNWKDACGTTSYKGERLANDEALIFLLQIEDTRHQKLRFIEQQLLILPIASQYIRSPQHGLP